MTGHQLGLLFSAISFTIGALFPTFQIPFKFTFRNINWISLGLAFFMFSHYIGAPK